MPVHMTMWGCSVTGDDAINMGLPEGSSFSSVGTKFDGKNTIDIINPSSLFISYSTFQNNPISTVNAKGIGVYNTLSFSIHSSLYRNVGAIVSSDVENNVLFITGSTLIEETDTVLHVRTKEQKNGKK